MTDAYPKEAESAATGGATASATGGPASEAPHSRPTEPAAEPPTAEAGVPVAAISAPQDAPQPEGEPAYARPPGYTDDEVVRAAMALAEHCANSVVQPGPVDLTAGEEPGAPSELGEQRPRAPSTPGAYARPARAPSGAVPHKMKWRKTRGRAPRTAPATMGAVHRWAAPRKPPRAGSRQCCSNATPRGMKK